MILHHYYLSNPQKVTLHNKSIIVPLSGTISNDDPTLYVTTDFFYDSCLARQRLSVTYHPQYDVAIDTKKVPNLKTIDNTNKPLDLDNVQIKNISRVWPAFGKTGGAHECLILAPNPIKSVAVTKTKLINGGATDKWHQDATANYAPVIATAIASEMIEALKTPNSDLPPQESYLAKAVANGVVITSPFKNKNVTLSAAWKNLNIFPEFKFWACLWSDDKNRNIRTMLPPFSETVSLNSCPRLLFDVINLGKYAETDLQESYVYSILTEKIRFLLKRLTGISARFYDFHSRKIVIPP